MNEKFKIEIVNPHLAADTSSTSEQDIPSKVIVETMDPAQHPPSTNGSHTPLQRGVKQAPVCRIPALRKEHMSADQLSKHCFEKETGEEMSLLSRHSFSPKDEEEDKKDMDHIGTNDGNTVTVNPKAWERFKKSILQRQESRTGRDRQRFATDPVSGERLRLVTGTVPIMKDGQILLVSSSSKPEWILPKGGWESDETCEVSALRETYEEGGILGTLGPRLQDVEFETRKGKKRRLELESLKKKVQIAYGTTGLPHAPLPSSVTAPSSSVSVSSNDRNSEACHSEDDMQPTAAAATTITTTTTNNNNNNDHNAVHPHGTIGQSSPHHKDHHHHHTKRLDDNESFGSVASITSEHSSSANIVRMIMFPLYVLEVREHWPESGRARKVVDIDTAIQIMESRPEFQKVLLEVKEKGYHLMPQENEKLDVLKNTII